MPHYVSDNVFSSNVAKITINFSILKFKYWYKSRRDVIKISKQTLYNIYTTELYLCDKYFKTCIVQ